MSDEQAKELAIRWQKLIAEAEVEDSWGRTGYANQLRNEALSIEIDLNRAGFTALGLKQKKKGKT